MRTLTKKDSFAERPEESELCEDVVWKLHNALYRYRTAPKVWHQHVLTLLESLKFMRILTDSSCFRNVDLDINMFMHVDDGLLFGLSNVIPHCLFCFRDDSHQRDARHSHHCEDRRDAESCAYVCTVLFYLNFKLKESNKIYECALDQNSDPPFHLATGRHIWQRVKITTSFLAHFPITINAHIVVNAPSEDD